MKLIDLVNTIGYYTNLKICSVDNILECGLEEKLVWEGRSKDIIPDFFVEESDIIDELKPYIMKDVWVIHHRPEYLYVVVILEEES